jgi:hypothetical protein
VEPAGPSVTGKAKRNRVKLAVNCGGRGCAVQARGTAFSKKTKLGKLKRTKPLQLAADQAGKLRLKPSRKLRTRMVGRKKLRAKVVVTFTYNLGPVGPIKIKRTLKIKP